MSIRKPQNDYEKERVEELYKHLNIASEIVNAYEATEFEGKVVKTINLEKGTILSSAIFLDNGNIAAILLTDKRSCFTLNIYHQLTMELITSTVIHSSKGIHVLYFRLSITTSRNILISFILSNTRPIGCIHHYNQEGQLLWTLNHNHSYLREVVILNDDTVLLRDEGVMKFVNQDRKDIFEFSRFYFNHSRMDNEYTPYGKRGFISYILNIAYLYNDDLEEKKILELDITTEITVLKSIDKDRIIYGTNENSVFVHNVTEGREISRFPLRYDVLLVKTIELLPDNRCFVGTGNYRNYGHLDIARILNLNNTENYIEKEYFSKRDVEYIGIASNGDIMLSAQVSTVPLTDPDETFIYKYNVSSKKDTSYNIRNGKVLALSPFDRIITTNGSQRSEFTLME